MFSTSSDRKTSISTFSLIAVYGLTMVQSHPLIARQAPGQPTLSPSTSFEESVSLQQSSITNEPTPAVQSSFQPNTNLVSSTASFSYSPTRSYTYTTRNNGGFGNTLSGNTLYKYAFISLYVMVPLFAFLIYKKARALSSRRNMESDLERSARAPKKVKKTLDKEDLELYPVAQFDKSMIPNFDHSDHSYDPPETVKNKENESGITDCLICFEHIEEGENIRLIPCKHNFHQECLDTWLTTRSTFCPTCRYDLKPLDKSELDLEAETENESGADTAVNSSEANSTSNGTINNNNTVANTNGSANNNNNNQAHHSP